MRTEQDNGMAGKNDRWEERWLAPSEYRNYEPHPRPIDRDQVLNLRDSMAVHGQRTVAYAIEGEDGVAEVIQGRHRGDGGRSIPNFKLHVMVLRRQFVTPEIIRQLIAMEDSNRKLDDVTAVTLVVDHAKGAGISFERAARDLGIDPAKVSRLRWLLNAPEIAQMVRERAITAEQATLLQKAPETKRLEWAKALAAKSMTTAQLKESLKRPNAKKKETVTFAENGLKVTLTYSGDLDEAIKAAIKLMRDHQ